MAMIGGLYEFAQKDKMVSLDNQEQPEYLPIKTI